MRQKLLEDLVLSKLQIYFLSASSQSKQTNSSGTSLMAQWLRTCLPMQGTQVRALVREDPTCHGEGPKIKKKE